MAKARGEKAATKSSPPSPRERKAEVTDTRTARASKRSAQAAEAAEEEVAESPQPVKAARTPARTKKTATETADLPTDNPNHSAYYLMKQEPADWSIDDLAKAENATDCWEGVRNFRARNIMQAMRRGQRAFFYHSNCKPPGIVGVISVVREAYPDDTQFDASSKYYDPKATQEKPRWFMVDVKLERKLRRQISLDELKQHKTNELQSMQLFTTARLSVQNVTQAEWDFILSLEDQAPEEQD